MKPSIVATLPEPEVEQRIWGNVEWLEVEILQKTSKPEV